MGSAHAVIMAGGSGTRFWPASRSTRPKQVLPLAEGRALVEAAVERVAGICPPDKVWIVTSADQREPILNSLPQFPREQVIVEPEPRDTAPCVALALATVAARDPGATIVCLPADHVIRPVAEFERMISRGEALAADGETIVTFGIPPTSPDIGYGYIELGSARDDDAPAAYTVAAFREKPDLPTAERFMREGRFWWNSGVLLFRTDAMLAQMKAHCPELFGAAVAMQRARERADEEALYAAFRSAPQTSIDYAVIEAAGKLAVVEFTAAWDDVGGFPSLARIMGSDDDGNTCALFKDASAELLESRGNIVYAEGDRTVALFGVEGMVVAAVGDAVLVCPKDRAHELKKLVARLRERGREGLL